MRVLTKYEALNVEEKIVPQLIAAARQSLCIKSQRGSAITKNGGNTVVATGFNKPQKVKGSCSSNGGCLRKEISDNSQVELCNSVHAEQMALLNLRLPNHRREGTRLYHLNLKMVSRWRLGNLLALRVVK